MKTKQDREILTPSQSPFILYVDTGEHDEKAEVAYLVHLLSGKVLTLKPNKYVFDEKKGKMSTFEGEILSPQNKDDVGFDLYKSGEFLGDLVPYLDIKITKDTKKLYLINIDTEILDPVLKLQLSPEPAEKSVIDDGELQRWIIAVPAKTRPNKIYPLHAKRSARPEERKVFVFNDYEIANEVTKLVKNIPGKILFKEAIIINYNLVKWPDNTLTLTTNSVQQFFDNA